MKSISKIGVTLPENNCGPINLEITEINGPGTTSYLDVEGILPTDPLWDTWEWQINVDWVFNATNANWTTSQIGGLIFNLAGDDTSVRVKFTKGSCVYYSNVSGMYDHPSYDCPTIELFIPPFITDVGNEAVLNIDGITGASPLWNTWKWQVAVNYLPTPTPNPTWVDAQTGGLTYTINTDDTIIRVVLTNGNCIYYSNESGYQCPCCDRVWMQLYEAGQSPILYYSGIVGAQIHTWIWQENNPVGFTWTDVQTGGTSYPDYEDGYLYRIKYVDTVGCTHYSNIALGFNV
jgi:hypothetical protein